MTSDDMKVLTDADLLGINDAANIRSMFTGFGPDTSRRCLATINALKAELALKDKVVADLSAALRAHHDWQLGSGVWATKDDQGGWIEIDNSEAYAESAMCDRTLALLAGRPSPVDEERSWILQAAKRYGDFYNANRARRPELQAAELIRHDMLAKMLLQAARRYAAAESDGQLPASVADQLERAEDALRSIMNYPNDPDNGHLNCVEAVPGMVRIAADALNGEAPRKSAAATLPDRLRLTEDEIQWIGKTFADLADKFNTSLATRSEHSPAISFFVEWRDKAAEVRDKARAIYIAMKGETDQ